MKPIPRNKYGKYLWQREHIDFLKANWQDMTNQQLADALGIKLTKCRTKLYELGLKRMELEYWTDEQVEFLKANYRNIGDTELSEMFAERWPKKKGWSKKHIEKKRRYLKLKRTAAQKRKIKQRNVDNGRFAMCPVKAWETRGGAAPVGTIKVWQRDSKTIPIAVIKQEKGYIHYNRWLFENTYFTLPSDILVVTRSGKVVAEGPDDLMIIDRAQHARRNRQLPHDLRFTKRILHKIEAEITNR
jgi:hypothetical protein